MEMPTKNAAGVLYGGMECSRLLGANLVALRANVVGWDGRMVEIDLVMGLWCDGDIPRTEAYHRKVCKHIAHTTANCRFPTALGVMFC